MSNDEESNLMAGVVIGIVFCVWTIGMFALGWMLNG